MKFTLTAVLGLLAASATAQDLSGLPECAKSCFVKAFPSSGCQAKTDFHCLCASDPYIKAIRVCVVSACSTSDGLIALSWATKKCKAAGSPLNPFELEEESN